MKDLTAIFLTQNEVPEKWAEFHRECLIKALDGAPLIIMGRKVPNWKDWEGAGLALYIPQDKPKCLSNIYWQLLRACKEATTDYIAVVEDDTLYSKEHFLYRPRKDRIGYNMNHWSLFTWGIPTYSWRNRRGNYSMLAYRPLVIEALEERFAKYPNGTPERITGEIGRPMVERNMGITLRKVEEFETTISIINFNHANASDDLQIRQRKSLGEIRAFDVPFWGKAEELVKKWK